MKWGRVILVIFGALVVTALGIDASDTLRGADGTLLSRVIREGDGACPLGMVTVEHVPSVTCVDAYEASAGEGCGIGVPAQMLETQRNMQSKDCAPVSKEGALPWSYVTRDQAMQLCARAGKRLPTAEEWYALGLGMTDVESSCNVSSGAVVRTGSSASCTSPDSVSDLVGNVWEWASDDVINGTYKSFTLPGEGYVLQVDAGGMATAVGETPQELFESDYFWSRTDGAYGIIRGGYYASGADAGLYAVHADTLPTTASAGIGFRCVR